MGTVYESSPRNSHSVENFEHAIVDLMAVACRTETPLDLVIAAYAAFQQKRANDIAVDAGDRLDEIAKGIAEGLDSISSSLDGLTWHESVAENIGNIATYISESIDRLGLNNASTPFGAIEAHSMSIEKVAEAIHDLTDAVENRE